MRFLKNKLTVTIIVLSVSFLIIIGVSVGRKNTNFAESGVGSGLNYIQGKVFKFSSNFDGLIDFFANYHEVKEENEALKVKNGQLLDMEQKYKTLEEKYEDLRKFQQFQETSTYKYKGADIIGRSQGGWIDAIFINQGSKDGMKEGMVAVNNEGALVGKITLIADDWAKIETLGNVNIAVSGKVSDNAEDNGIVKGYKGINNKAMATLSSIPRESAIKAGDVVVTRGLDQSYPENIRIGTVISVSEDKGKLAKTAVIEPFTDFNKLQEVFIVIPENMRDIKY